MRQLSLLLANKLCAEQIIDPEEKDLYIYGFEITMANMINFFIMLTIGVLGKALVEIGCFYVVFITTRRITGGYHADSYGKCFTLFALTNGSVLLFVKVFQHFPQIQWMVLSAAVLIFMGVVYKKAPMEHENRLFTKEEAFFSGKGAYSLPESGF